MLSLPRHRWRDFVGEIRRILTIRFGGWRFAGGSMRSILNTGLAAAVATLLCFGLSSALAQKSKQANKLEDKVLEL